MVLAVLIAIPTWLFILAGRQLDLNRNLFEAVRRNDAPTVEFLLSAGAEANAREPLHDTRSMLQQIFGRMRGIPAPAGPTALLVHFSLVKTDINPATPWTARPENVAMVRALLDHHADPNVRVDYDSTPLMMAVKQEKDSTLQLLLARGGKVNLKDSQGNDALHDAVELGSPERVRLLLDAGAEVNSRDNVQNTPLMNAVTQKDEEIVKLLIARGADVNARDSAEDSVLTYAVRAHSPPLVALLKAAGAK